ncbi:elongation of very long chain fatty acids protein 4, partial [Caerostris extrusa]
MATASLVEYITSGRIADRLLDDTFLFPTVIIGYVLFAVWIGPAVMKNRKAFDLRGLLIAYNFLEVLINGYITYSCVRLLYVERDKYCLLKNIQNTYPSFKYIFMNKMLELADTVFFVLRKKQNQVSFLHVSHHSLVCTLTWWCIRNIIHFGGFCVIMCIGINAFIHCAMYSYYALAAFGPKVTKYLWWKKYITLIQLAQFTFDIAYMTIAFVVGCEEVARMELAL